MQKNRLWTILGHTALLTCATLSLWLFMLFPGSMSQAQEATFYNISTLPEKLTRISAATYLWDTLKAIFGMLFFGLACISAGMRLIGFLQLEQQIESETSPLRAALIPTYFLIGNAVFSVIFLTLASFSYLTQTYSLLVLGMGLVSGLSQFRKPPRLIMRVSNGSEKAIVILSAMILLFSLFQSSAHLSYDASAVYFSIAKRTAIEGQAGYYLENSFPASVLHAVIPYSVVMQSFGDQAARLVSWLFGAANIVIAVALARTVGVSTLARRILPVLLLTSTAFLDLIADGKVDLASSAYSIAAVYWIAADVQKPHKSIAPSIFSGFLIGFACIVRPYNVFLLGAFVFIYLILQMKRGGMSFSQVAQRGLWMIVGAAGFGMYHLYINKIFLGSPFAFWTSVANIDPVDGPWDFTVETIWVYRMLYPLVVTFKNSGASLGNITPLFIVFLSTLSVREIRNRIRFQKDALQLASSAGATLFLWVFLFFTIVEVRYVFFLWIILFILIAEVVSKVFEAENGLLRNAAKTWTILLLGFVFLRSIYISISTYSPLDTQGNPQCFDSSVCGIFTEINKAAHPGERILTLSAYRYYLRTDLFACSTRSDEYKILGSFPPAATDEFWTEVYRQGYKYIAFEYGYAREHARLNVIPGPENTPGWLELEPILGEPGDWKVAYKISVLDPPMIATLTCEQNPESGNWEVLPVSP